MTIEEIRDMYNQATRTDTPPPNAELKEIEPDVFAWVERTNDDDDGDTNE